jgi:hypothetical protein
MLTQTQAIIQANKDAARRISAALRRTHKIVLQPADARDLVARSLGAANWEAFAMTGPAA